MNKTAAQQAKTSSFFAIFSRQAPTQMRVRQPHGCRRRVCGMCEEDSFTTQADYRRE